MDVKEKVSGTIFAGSRVPARGLTFAQADAPNTCSYGIRVEFTLFGVYSGAPLGW
jgi:hypothetical protein